MAIGKDRLSLLEGRKVEFVVYGEGGTTQYELQVERSLRRFEALGS